MSTSDLAKPTIESRRIASIDVLRGLAMLGILVLNIQAFAMPFEAYGNPFAYGDIEGSNYWVFTFAMLLADMKFMAIFSLLFGAGMVLFVERLLETGRPAYAVHYRRMAWLLVIGLVHAYLIWYGDILVGYALCGMIVVWCRRFRPWLLCVLGLCLIAVCSVLMLGSGALIVNFMPEKLAMTAHGSQQQLESIAWQLESYTGSWSDQLSHRGLAALMGQTAGLFFFVFWRASGLMLIGMALYRWGVFSAQRSNRFYLIMLAVGVLIGLPLVALGLQAGWSVDWQPTMTKMMTSQINYWASIFVAFGWIALIMLLVRSGLVPVFQHCLASVGRMALSNYLLQSIFCTLIFYGHGFGQFGTWDRTEQMLLVLALTICQLIWSPLWLGAFRFGPAEWLWRSLTYWKLQPMRRPSTTG
ncbi:MAG: DUF418 domain-containing protein [Phycisphaerales bacterium]|nr:DUF418 domain-containing protein [Phycisphaerales bacterium]